MSNMALNDIYQNFSSAAYRSTTDENDGITPSLSVFSVYPDDDSSANQLLGDGHVNTTGYDVMEGLDEGIPFSISFYVRCVLACITLAGNIFNIAIITKYVKHVTPTHIALAFQATANILAGGLPFIQLALTGDKPKSMCGFTLFVMILTYYMNSFSIMLIAAERCILLVSWKWYKQFWTNKKQACLCACACFWCVFVGAVTTLHVDSEIRLKSCFFTQLTGNKLLVYMLTILSYLLASLILIFCYLRILYFLWKHRMTMNSSTSQRQREKKTTRLVAVILTVYIIGTLPVINYRALQEAKSQNWNRGLVIAFRIIWHVSTLLNTFIYVFKAPEFHQVYEKVFCCKMFRRKKVEPPDIQLRAVSVPVGLEPRR